MKNWFARFGSADTEHITSVYDIRPDVAEAFIAAGLRDIGDRRPRHAASFDDLIETIAHASRVIQAMEELREHSIVAADSTSPNADRRAIGIAAAMPPSRIYRVLEKHGRPIDRRAAGTADPTQKDSLAKAVQALGGVVWNPQRAVVALRDAGHEVDEKRARQILRDLAADGLLTKTTDRPVTYRTNDTKEEK